LRLAARWAPLVTSFLLCVFMCGFVSLVATVQTAGISVEVGADWIKAWGVSFLLAFPVVLLVMPLVRAIVSRICRPPET
jgi:hypothetical protein